jgi:hypothetical protein
MDKDKNEVADVPNMPDWEAVSALAGTEQTISVTYQTERGKRDRLERFAFVSGHRRSLPHGGGMVGNMSWAVNEATDFLFAHLEEYQAWQAERVAKALEQK